MKAGLLGLWLAVFSVKKRLTATIPDITLRFVAIKIPMNVMVTALQKCYTTMMRLRSAPHIQ